MQTMKLIGLLMVAAATLSMGRSPLCDCTRVTSKETTRLGGNEWIAYKEKGEYRRISGVVQMRLPELRENILVEIFDRPNYLLCNWRPGNPNKCSTNPPEHQRRIAACRTGKDGRFCFGYLPVGTYELRVSKDQGWSPTHVYVVVDPNSRKSAKRGLQVSLNIGI
jgi:hypothetical protein